MRQLIFDLETDGRELDRISRIWCLCAVDPDTERQWCFGPPQVIQGIRLLNRADQLVGHNVGRFDLPVLERVFGFQYRGEVVDTLVLSRLLFNGLSDEPDRYGRHALDAWGKRLDCHKGEWTEFAKWDPGMLDYCLQDCLVVQRLLEHFRRQDLSPDAIKLELGYEAFLRRIEQNGFGFDIDGAQELQGKLQRRLDRLQGYLDQLFPPTQSEGSRPQYYELRRKPGQPSITQDVHQFDTKGAAETWRKSQGLKPKEVEITAGPPVTKTMPFNANSPKQVIDALRQLGWKPEVFNENGSVNTSEVALFNSGLAAGRLIAAYRGYSKLYSFTKQWLKHQRDGRIHPTFVGNRAATGRSACKAPNIQQIPTAKQRKSGMRVLIPYGRRCRALFLPQAGYVLVGADLAGIEVRLLAHRLAPYDDEAFVQAVVGGMDFHQQTADKIGISRDQAKTVLYGSMYGQGATSLAKDLQISRNDAQTIIDAFTSGIPGFAEMKSDLVEDWKRSKRIELIDGRRIQVTREHKLLNYAIQGDAAILMKHWAMDVDRQLADTSFRMLAVVHDEMQTECSPDELGRVTATLETTAELVGERLGFLVRVEASAKIGASWQETH